MSYLCPIPFKERVDIFCARFELGGQWEELSFGTERMAIGYKDEKSFYDIWRNARAIRDAAINHSPCSKEGVFEGIIYIMDQHDAVKELNY